MWTWKQKSVSVVKQKYGHDEFAPTPDGVFVASFVGGSGVFADCSLRVSLVNVVYLRIVHCVFRCVNVALFQFVRNILAAHLWRIVCVFMVYLNSAVGLLFCKMMECVL